MARCWPRARPRTSWKTRMSAASILATPSACNLMATAPQRNAMKPSLQTRLGQQLSLTPQLRQAIRLLQLSALELEAEINAAVEANPLLDREDELSEADPGPPVDGRPAAEHGADRDGQGDGDSDGADRDSAFEAADSLDWAEPGSGSGGGGTGFGDGDLAEDRQPAAPEDLQDHLLWQLQL